MNMLDIFKLTDETKIQNLLKKLIFIVLNVQSLQKITILK